MRKNQSKKVILEALQDLKSAASAPILQTWLEVAFNVTFNLPALRMALCRLHKQSLVYREKGKYSLSPKGEARLVWLQSHIT